MTSPACQDYERSRVGKNEFISEQGLHVFDRISIKTFVSCIV